MKLSFILAQARNGELKSLSKIDKTDEVVTGYINLALIALYSRFQLKTEEAIITLETDPVRTIYTLGSSDSAVRVNGAPMLDDDVMSIIDGYNEDGSQIVFNDEKDPFSVFTIGYSQVQIPLVNENTYVSLVYRKNPTLVTYTEVNGVMVDHDVEIPLQLLEPMLHYIGYRAHGAVDGNINTENSTHYTRFEKACDKARELGVLTADDTVPLSVQAKGFV